MTQHLQYKEIGELHLRVDVAHFLGQYGMRYNGRILPGLKQCLLRSIACTPLKGIITSLSCNSYIGRTFFWDEYLVGQRRKAAQAHELRHVYCHCTAAGEGQSSKCSTCPCIISHPIVLYVVVQRGPHHQ